MHVEKYVMTHDAISSMRARFVVGPRRAAQIHERFEAAVPMHHDVGKVDRLVCISLMPHDRHCAELDWTVRVRLPHVRQAAYPAQVYLAFIEQRFAHVPGRAIDEAG